MMKDSDDVNQKRGEYVGCVMINTQNAESFFQDTVCDYLKHRKSLLGC